MRSNPFSVENPIRIIRELKGAPLSIVCALVLVDQRVTQSWLENMTGYTDKTISRALEYLKETGRIDRSSRGWQLIDGLQLVLPIRRPADINNLEDFEKQRSRRNSDSINTNTFNDSLEREDSKVLVNSNVRKNSDSGSATNSTAEGSTKREILIALECCEIGDPKKTELVELPGLTAVDVFAWKKKLEKKGDRYSPGLLIYVLENDQKIDLKSRDEMIRDYRFFCDDCRRFYCSHLLE